MCVCVCVCVYVCMYVCMYVYTCYAGIGTHPQYLKNVIFAEYIITLPGRFSLKNISLTNISRKESLPLVLNLGGIFPQASQNAHTKSAKILVFCVFCCFFC